MSQVKVNKIEEMLLKYMPHQEVVFDNGTLIVFPLQNDNTLTFKGLTKRGKEFESMTLDVSEIKEVIETLYNAAAMTMGQKENQPELKEIGVCRPVPSFITAKITLHIGAKGASISFRNKRAKLLYEFHEYNPYKLVEFADKLKYGLHLKGEEE